MVHTFGCSFTYGSGIRPEPLPHGGIGESFLGSNVYEDLIWPKELGRLLNQEVTNYGLGGTSNSWILEKVVESMQEFKKGDVVILGETDAPRFNFPVGGGDSNSSGYLHLIPDSASWLWSKEAKEKGYFNYAGTMVKNEDAELILNYFLYMFPKFMDFYTEVYERQYRSLTTFLNSMGVKCMYWRTGVWSLFERLDTWSFKYCDDGHWSPNGHLEFAATVKYALENKIHVLEFENTKNLISQVDLPDSYIRFNKDDL